LFVEQTDFLRLINKFKENGFEKFERLLHYHNKYSVVMNKIESGREAHGKDLEIEDSGELDLEIYSKKMEEGWLSMMMVDYIMILLSVNDSAVQEHFFGKYKGSNVGLFSEVKENIQNLTREQDNTSIKAQISEMADKFTASLV